MALRGTAAQGPTHPGSVTVAQNDRLVSALIAEEVVQQYANRPAHAEVCDRGFESEWRMYPHGDTWRIPVEPRYRSLQGYSGADADTFQAQKELSPSVPLTMGQPSKVEVKRDIYDKGSYISEKQLRMRARKRVETLIDTAESEIAQTQSNGHQRGVQTISDPTKVPNAASGANVANSICAAPGLESTNYPGATVFAAARATLIALGVTMREHCALLTPASQSGFSIGALAAPYELPWGGEAARKAMVSGGAKLSWTMKETVHTPTFSYGSFIQGASGIQLRAQPAEGATQVQVRGMTASSTIPAGTRVAFAGSNSVNGVRGQATGTLEHYRLTAAARADGSGNATWTLDHGIFASATGDAVRTRNCTARPANNAVVYVNGLASTDPAARAAVANATVDQSLLVSRDATALVTQDPELPRDTILAKQTTIDGYKTSVTHVIWSDWNAKQIRDSLLLRQGHAVVDPPAGMVLFGAEAGTSALV